jgi:indolepyruvate ferredoxin oxidoreductase alpha subunit
MGASIGMAHGFEKARGGKSSEKVVAILGDSTFMHSGITGLMDVAYNKGTSTVIILDNSITGMTGHQENPSTGRTIKGEPTVTADIEKLAQAVGIKRVRVEDPFNLEEFEKAVIEETAANEPSVIISRRPCVLLKSVDYGKQFEINQDNCRKCRKCMSISCPAIALKDKNIVINRTLCVGCGLCEKLCKFGAITREGSC